MGESYRPFAKFLAVGSIVIWLGLSIVMMAGSFVGGLILSALGFIILGFFLKIVAFVFEPNALQIYKGEDPPLEELETGERISRIAEAVYAPREPKSRILGPVREEPVQIRIYQESPDPREKAKEDKEWAEMFKAL